jgi:hypothetical protein
MHVMPSEVGWGSAAAWADLPGRISAFQDRFAHNMPVQMHEMGHNLGFHHSGADGSRYGDNSCAMSTAGWGDDGPLVCYNGVKSFQSDWYTSANIMIDVLSHESFDGLLVGVDDYVNGRSNPNTHNLL